MTERFHLSPEAVAVLASPEHEAYGMGMFHRFPQTMAALDDMPESFRTGVGHDYDSHGPEGAVGIERSFEPWNRHHLLPDVLPALDGVVGRLEAGVDVADIGCGAGGAVLLMAQAFPNSRFVGYDISRYALDRAEQRLGESGLTNVRFVDPRDEPLPTDGTCGLITTFDCIHDMTDPVGMIHAIRAALAEDGTWLLVDIKARDTFTDNVAKNPDGCADVRHQRAVVHVVGDVVSRRRRARHARSAGQPGEGDCRGRRLRPVPAAADRPFDQRLLRDPTVNDRPGTPAMTAKTNGAT